MQIAARGKIKLAVLTMLIPSLLAQDANLYIYRLRFFTASKRKMTLSVDGVPLAYLQNGRYIAVAVPVGEHVLSDKRPEMNVKFQIEPDHAYYIRTEFVPDRLVGFVTRFIMEHPETAKGDLQRLRLADPGQIRNWEIVREPKK